jgi:hypothetical protein
MKSSAPHEKGNALIYVLIAIALFAALSMTFGRQSGSGESDSLNDDKAELYAVQLINYAGQAKSAVDQMLFSGTRIGALDFKLPNQAGFGTGAVNQVYHPQGGGLTPGLISPEAVAQVDTDPPAGWYMGRFNNVEWTKTTGQDVILVAYQINKKVCQRINEKITGSTDIPAMSDEISKAMINGALHSHGNIDFTTDTDTVGAICTPCDGKPSLCVKSQSGEIYGFYTIIADQ